MTPHPIHHTRTAEPGAFVYGSRGIPHGFAVEGEAPAGMLLPNTPAGFEGFAVEAGRASEELTLPTPEKKETTLASSLRRGTALFVAVGAMLALLASAAMAQTAASGPVDAPPEFAQLRQQYEGLTPEQVEAAGYVPEGPCVPSPTGVGAMGTHAINQQYLGAQFPNGTMDSTTPPVLLLGHNGEVIGLEWEAADVGQGPMEMFGQTIQLQPPHPGVDEPHYMLHELCTKSPG